MALRRRWFSVSSSFMRLTWLDLSPPYSWRQRSYVTSVTPIERTASATGVPCATSTSTWRSLDTISSGLCLFLDMGSVLLRLSRAIPQGGPLQGGRIKSALTEQATGLRTAAESLGGRPHVALRSGRLAGVTGAL